MYLSARTIAPLSNAGRTTVATLCALSAAYSNASARGETSPPCRSSLRIWRPSSVPPGSLVVTTSKPRPRSHSASNCIWVVLPDPSPPSKVMNIGYFLLLAAVAADGLVADFLAAVFTAPDFEADAFASADFAEAFPAPADLPEAVVPEAALEALLEEALLEEAFEAALPEAAFDADFDAVFEADFDAALAEAFFLAGFFAGPLARRSASSS